jgi:hypothetical protein
MDPLVPQKRTRIRLDPIDGHVAGGRDRRRATLEA